MAVGKVSAVSTTDVTKRKFALVMAMTPMGSHEHSSERAGAGEGHSGLAGEMHRIQRCGKEERKFQTRMKVIFCLFVFAVYFHYHLVPLYPTPTIITLLSMSMSPLSFLLNPSTP